MRRKIEFSLSGEFSLNELLKFLITSFLVVIEELRNADDELVV
jgi:hypothetical protein